MGAGLARSKVRSNAVISRCCAGPFPNFVYTKNIYLSFGIVAMKTAKVFRHGNSQAVRLPKEFRFEDDEVVVQRHGEGVLLLPRRYSYDDLLKVVEGFQGPVERGAKLPPQKRKF